MQFLGAFAYCTFPLIATDKHFMTSASCTQICNEPNSGKVSFEPVFLINMMTHVNSL